MSRACVRFGILGCADIAWRRMLPAMQQVGEIELVAVASREGKRAARFADRFGCAAVEGYDRLLGRPDIDAIYIPLPAGLHADWTARAIRAGKHVLVEKPLTTSLAQAQALTRLAARRNLVLTENFTFLHHAQHAAIRRLVADGAIGELRSFSSAFTVPPFPSSDIRYRADLGGGALLDIGVYPVRVAQYFLGDTLTVAGSALRRDHPHAVETGGAALLTSPQGVTAQLTFGMADAYRSWYELCGSEGRISLDRVFTPPQDYAPQVRIERQDGTRRDLALPPDHQFANAARAFARAVLEGTACTDAILRQAGLIDEIRHGSVPTRAEETGR